MPTRLLESVIETTDLPHPATRLTISSCFGWGDEAEYWALLIVGTFYDATGRAFWSNEIFLGQLLWRDGHDGNLRGDTESESSSDSSSEATNIVVDATASSQEDTESEGTDEEDDSESLSESSSTSSSSEESKDSSDDGSDTGRLANRDRYTPAFTPPVDSRFIAQTQPREAFWIDRYDPVHRRRVHQYIC